MYLISGEKIGFLAPSRDSTKDAVIRVETRKFDFFKVLEFKRIFSEVNYDRKQACRLHVIYRLKRRVG